MKKKMYKKFQNSRKMKKFNIMIPIIKKKLKVIGLHKNI